MLKIAEVILPDGDILIFDELTERKDFKLILNEFLEIKEVRLVKETEDEYKKACLLETDNFQFVLVYDSDLFVWNYMYAVKKENHGLLKELCRRVAEFIS